MRSGGGSSFVDGCAVTWIERDVAVSEARTDFIDPASKPI